MSSDMPFIIPEIWENHDLFGLATVFCLVLAITVLLLFCSCFICVCVVVVFVVVVVVVVFSLHICRVYKFVHIFVWKIIVHKFCCKYLKHFTNKCPAFHVQHLIKGTEQVIAKLC